MYDPQKPHEEKAVRDCVHNMMIRALEMEGTVSVSYYCETYLNFSRKIHDTDIIQGEHGIGLGKKVGTVQVSKFFLSLTHSRTVCSRNWDQKP
jgi:hypothetical protein